MSQDSATELDGYDIFSEEYSQAPEIYWKALANQKCPIAKTDKWGGSWMLVRYSDVYDIVQNPDVYSSRAVEAAGEIPAEGKGLLMPPITSAAPEHAGHRSLLDPFLSPQAVRGMEPFIREVAAERVRDLRKKGKGDLAADFARPIALAVLAKILDVPSETHDLFLDWAVRVLRVGPTNQEMRRDALVEMMDFLDELATNRRGSGGSDIISIMAEAELDGVPITRKHMLGTLLELVIAGADTTWSTIGASMWHLAGNPEDRKQLAAEPEKIRRGAVEEFLRVFSPVTIARITNKDVEVHGKKICANSRVIMPLAGANRDPEIFEDPDDVKIDRRRNRHMAFGTGTHRCAGAHLARAEIAIALEEWLSEIPEFELDGPDDVVWARGQVRGPEYIPFRVL